MIYTGKGVLRGLVNGKPVVIKSGDEIPKGAIDDSQSKNLKAKGWVSEPEKSKVEKVKDTFKKKSEAD